MSGCLLDTNVVSEMVKPAPEPRVIAFLMHQADQWLSSIVLHEMRFGLELLPQGSLRDRLGSALSAIVTQYVGLILPVGRAEAEQAAVLRARARQSGRVLRLADALIAGTAAANELWVATRNVRDFEGLGVDVTDPWDHP